MENLDKLMKTLADAQANTSSYRKIMNLEKKLNNFRMPVNGLLNMEKDVVCQHFHMIDGRWDTIEAMPFDTLNVKAVSLGHTGYAGIRLECTTDKGYEFSVSLAHLTLGQYELVLE